MSPKDSALLRRAAWVILLTAIGLGAWLSYKYLLPILLPFLISWLLSSAIRPMVGKLAGQRPIARRLVTAFLVILFTGLLVFGIIKGGERAVSELGRFMEGLAREDSDISLFFTDLSDWMTSLSEHLPFLDRFEDHPAFDRFCAYLDSIVRNGAQSALTTLGEKVPAFLMAFVGQLPSVLIFITALLLSCYYFSADPKTPGERLGALLPASFQTSFYLWRTKLKKALTGYVKAYLLLGLITFGEMFLGLSILKVPYAFLLAWVIALVDFLPLLGAGTVLIPWAVVSLVLGNGGTATGLLIIFGIHTLLRQVLEPRLLSRELGLSPLVSLVAIYAGWRLFGVGGMIVAPLVVMVGKEWWAQKET